MADDTTDIESPTRREYVKYGGTVLSAGLLAGCTGDAERGTGSAPTEAVTETDTTTADGSYSVSMSPMGAVTFDSPPETVFTRLTHHADMALALGRGDTVTAMHAP
ncbi:ABC transporter substrate-binding protein, partial [Haloarcula hispanica]